MRIILLLLLPLSLLAEIPLSGKKSIEYRKEKVKIWRQLGAEVLKHSKDPEDVKKLTVKIIEDFSDFKCLIGDFKTYSDLLPAAQKILSMKPKDPFTKSFCGMITLYGGNDRQSDFEIAKKNISEGTKALEKSAYSPFAKMLSARWHKVTVVRSQSIKGKDENAIRSNYTKKLIAWVDRESPESHQRFIAEQIAPFINERNRYFSHIEQFHNAIAKSTKLKPWLKEYEAGVFNKSKAWHIRGGGYANTVKEEAWAGFKKHLEIAAQHLKKAHKLRPDYPEAASNLISVSMSGGTKEQGRYWFEESVKAEVDYQSSYSTYLWYTRPRWGGSHEAMLAFGKECEETGLYDTLVPAMHIIAINDVRSELGGDYERFKDMDLYPHLHRVAKEYEKREQEQKQFVFANKEYIKALHFSIAYKIGKFSHVRKLYQLYGDGLYSRSVFDGFNIDFKPAVSLAYAMSGPASSLVKKLDSQLNWESNNKTVGDRWRSEKEVDFLLQELKDAQGMTSEKESELYFKKLQGVADLEKKFHSGNWVDLTFTEDLHMWHIYGGNFDVEDEKTILASNLDNRRQYISSNGFFKPPYTLEVEVESIKSNWRGRHLQAGLIVGRMFGAGTGRTFWVDGLRRRSGIGIPGKDPAGINISNKGRKHKLTVNIWPGQYEVMVNDKEIIIEDDPKFVPYRVSLGIMPWYGISGVVRYKNFRIKKIDFPAPPKESNKNYDEVIAYYEDRLKSRQASTFYHKLGFAYWNKKDYAKSSESYEKAIPLNGWYIYPYYAALAAIKAGKYEKVTRFLEETLKRTNNKQLRNVRPEILNQYSWFMSTCPEEKYRNAKKAEKMVNEAIKLTKNPKIKASFLDTLACAQALKGDFNQAINTLNKAAKLNKEKDFQKVVNKKLELFKKKQIYLEMPEGK